jgi:hypothetical protein
LVKRLKRYFGKKRQTSNYYSLEGLVTKLKAIEPEFTKQVEQERLRKKKFETTKPAA